MREVLIKIDELQTLLESKIKATEVLNKQLSVKKLDADTVTAKAIAKFNHAAAMERVYKKYEDFDNEVKAFNKDRNSSNDITKELEEQKKVNDDLKKKLDEKEAALDAKKASIAKQVIALKEREVAFDRKKQELRAMVTGDSIKELLK